MATIIELISGLLKFPQEILLLIKILSKTPVEKQADLMVAIQKEADNYAKTGRPSWE